MSILREIDGHLQTQLVTDLKRHEIENLSGD